MFYSHSEKIKSMTGVWDNTEMISHQHNINVHGLVQIQEQLQGFVGKFQDQIESLSCSETYM
jgi:hypothetical protein